MKLGTFALREARSQDIDAIQKLILEHGPNPWNHLPEEEIRQHVEGIASKDVHALLAHVRGDFRGDLIGVVTYEIGRRYPQYQKPHRQDIEHGYLAEAVVHSAHAGKGIGTQLLRGAIERLLQYGVREVYAMRHADNIASGKMMEKAGMEKVAEFEDPEIRHSGSRKTFVARYSHDDFVQKAMLAAQAEQAKKAMEATEAKAVRL